MISHQTIHRQKVIDRKRQIQLQILDNELDHYEGRIPQQDIKEEKRGFSLLDLMKQLLP